MVQYNSIFSYYNIRYFPKVMFGSWIDYSRKVYFPNVNIIPKFYL